MRTYILSVAAAAVISAAVSVITPEKWSKYVGMVTGLVVALCIASPILNLIHADLFEGFDYADEVRGESGEAALYSELRAELGRRIASDAAARLRSEFGLDCEVGVELESDANGRVTGVGVLSVYGDKTDAAAIGRLREIYGAREVVYVGHQKNTEKSE